MRRLGFLLFLAWLAALFGYAAWRMPAPLNGAPALLRSLAALALLLCAMAALGRSLLLRFKLRPSSLSEEAAFSLGLGAGSLSFLLFPLFHFGGVNALLAWVLIGLLLLALLEHLEHFAVELGAALRTKHPLEGSSTEMLSLLAAALALLPALALALAPATFYDALAYHLAMPMRAAETGSYRPAHGLLHSWLPGAMEQLWTLCLLLDGQRLAGLLNISLGLAAALAVADAGARILPHTRLWLPAALLLTQPMLSVSLGAFSSDGGAMFLAFLSLYAFLNSLGQRSQAEGASWLGLSALCAGLAAAAKPVAFAQAGVLLLLLFSRALADRDERRPGLLLGCAALFTLPLLPWLLRGGLLAGNPLMPFGLTVWGRELLPPASPAYLGHMAGFGAGQPLWSLPWRMSFEPSSFGGGGHLSFLFLGALPAALLLKHTRETRWLGAYAALSLLFWAAGPRVLRYLLPSLPGLCLLLAYALVEAEGWARSRGWALALRMLTAGALFLGAAQGVVIVAKDFDPFRAALGLEREEDYLARRDVDLAAAGRWVRARARRPGILLLGDSRGAYLPGRVLAASVFEQHPFRAWLDKASTPQELDAVLAQKGYDFVLVNRKEWARVGRGAGPHYAYFSSPQKEALFAQWLSGRLALGDAKTFDSGAVAALDLR